MRLPTPQQLDSLVLLAEHHSASAQAQAVELCRMLPRPVRILAAAHLAEQHAFLAAVRCAWPDRVDRADALRKAVILDCAAHISERWRRLTGGSDALHRTLHCEQPATARNLHQELMATARRHSSRTIHALAGIGVAALHPDSTAALRRCAENLPLACEQPHGALPWLASRLLRHLARQAPLTDDDRRWLAGAFAEALSIDDVERAGLLLTGGCAYAVHSQQQIGPEAILASYASAAQSGQARFDTVAHDRRVGAVGEEQAIIHFADHVTLHGQQHTYRCQQRLWFDPLGRIWRIEHIELPGQREALRKFEQSLSGRA